MDGEPIEFEWKNFPGFTGLEILHRIQYDLKNLRIESEQFRNRILFMSMFNDIDIYKRGNEDTCRTLGIHWTRKRRKVFSWL